MEAEPINPAPPKPHIVILTSATGGGHTACANALRHAFQAQYGERFKITIVDLWTDYAPRPLNLLPRWYYFFTNVLPSVWVLLWYALKQPFIERPLFALIGWWVRPRVVAAFQSIKPDIVIAVHPLVQRGVRQAIQGLPPADPLQKIPWFTVVTDLVSAHPIWFDASVTRCFVPTEEVVKSASANKLTESQIVVGGLPSLHQAYETGSTACPTVLVMGGAEGMGSIHKIALAIDEELGNLRPAYARMVIICGTNERIPEKYPNRGQHICKEIIPARQKV